MLLAGLTWAWLGLTGTGCSVLFRDSPIQCETDADCHALGALDTECQVSIGVCVKIDEGTGGIGGTHIGSGGSGAEASGGSGGVPDVVGECLTSDDCIGGTECTVATCDPDRRCVYTPADELCDDGDACTFDTCTETGCTHRPVDDVGTGATLLWDNGPFVTHEGEGPDGTDLSMNQSQSLGLTTIGYNAGAGANFRLAAEFQVTDERGWYVSDVVWFAYQTGSTTTSTIEHVNYRIWNGSPDDPESQVVFGDVDTDRLSSTEFTGVYRVGESSLSSTNRPIMSVEATAGIRLEPGTYWLDWQIGGSLSANVWQVPITILGEATTGHALQLASGSWNPVQDGGAETRQGLVFLVRGLTCSPVQ